ncbi:hypothetical protein D9758_013987 [Tetrapyrgos nigripes]|uniref:Uncharacterized protein n=1 Tax=Tetrapyrgos nigripes TaxID=182062 RepID=A0A8H5G7R9_9AGAR|nr:hypothetical protein D9758_013987 [Tetrapyrgos nigripes]
MPAERTTSSRRRRPNNTLTIRDEMTLVNRQIVSRAQQLNGGKCPRQRLLCPAREHFTTIWGGSAEVNIWLHEGEDFGKFYSFEALEDPNRRHELPEVLDAHTSSCSGSTSSSSNPRSTRDQSRTVAHGTGSRRMDQLSSPPSSPTPTIRRGPQPFPMSLPPQRRSPSPFDVAVFASSPLRPGPGRSSRQLELEQDVEMMNEPVVLSLNKTVSALVYKTFSTSEACELPLRFTRRGYHLVLRDHKMALGALGLEVNECIQQFRDGIWENTAWNAVINVEAGSLIVLKPKGLHVQM